MSGNCACQEDIEVHLHAPETKTKHLRLCVWANAFLKNCIVVWKQHLDRKMHVGT